MLFILGNALERNGEGEVKFKVKAGIFSLIWLALLKYQSTYGRKVTQLSETTATQYIPGHNRTCLRTRYHP